MFKLHPSSAGKIMTNKPGKTNTTCVDELSETAKNHLIEFYIEDRFNRKKDIENKYIQKGLMCEDDSITLYSRVTKKIFFKNEETLENDFLIGTPDLYTGTTINKAETVIDIKTSWDIYTFFQNKVKPVDKNYFYQLQCYMALTGATSSKLAYCLIDTPYVLINQEKERLLYKMGVTTRENAEYLEACERIEMASIFGDVPQKERVIQFTVNREQAVIDKIYERVKICREWYNQFAEQEIVSV
jgi:hypothetical protein